MEGKKIGAIITLILLIPTIIGFLILNFHMLQDPTNQSNIEEGVKLIADNAVPWWVYIFEWLASLNGIIAVILIILFIYFLKWIGEIK